MTDHLNDLRETINRLDDDILALVRRRMTLAGDIIAAKGGNAAYRPGREAAVIERLAASAPDLPRQLVANLWRQLMTASTALQDAALEVAVHHQAMAVAGWHFGGLVTIRECADLEAVKSRLDTGVGLALVPVRPPPVSRLSSAGSPWVADYPPCCPLPSRAGYPPD